MTKRTIVLLAVLFCFVGSVTQAQEPVVGVKDPESLFKDPDAKLIATSRQRCTSCASCCSAISGIVPANG